MCNAIWNSLFVNQNIINYKEDKTCCVKCLLYKLLVSVPNLYLYISNFIVYFKVIKIDIFFNLKM